jgi:hypothetical protein
MSEKDPACPRPDTGSDFSPGTDRGPGEREKVESAGAALSQDRIAVLRERIRDGAYDDDAVAEHVALTLVRQGLLRTENKRETP